MNFITTMCVAVFSYYFIYFFTLLLSPKKRQDIEQKNTKLDDMRTIPMKTLEQQKEFINTKYPKSAKIEWLKILFNIVLFLIIFSVIRFVFIKAGAQFNWWEGLLIIVSIILGIYFILRPYRLQNSDIGTFLKW